jgi:hypothetical protein
MSNEIELICDGDGLAVIGNPTDVERFLAAEGLPSKDLGLSRLEAVLRTAGQVLQSGAEMAAESGRWVKLTEDSAEAVSKFGLMDTSTSGVSHAMIGEPGEIKQWIQIVTSPSSMASNPAILTGAAGIMTQLAMQQAMDEITDYLARIDEKLDDVLRAQTNQVLARMDGVDLAVNEAMSVREAVGRVSEVTWSKVQHSSGTILETQGYALRQLGDLADKLEQKSKVGDLADMVKDAEGEVQKWLAVLARCLQLHDAVAVLELDRVLDAAPEELDRHRIGLKAARRDRVQLMTEITERLLDRMETAVGRANSRVLFNPKATPAVVRSSNVIAVCVHDFHGTLGIESGGEAAEARRWADAASEQWDRARETGSGGLDVVKDFGAETGGRAKRVSGRLSAGMSERARRRRNQEPGKAGDGDDADDNGVDNVE